MESGLVIQLLILAGVIAYGVWSARQKGKRGEDKVPHRMPGDENFPFPVSDSPLLREETVQIAEEERFAGRGVYRTGMPYKRIFRREERQLRSLLPKMI